MENIIRRDRIVDTFRELVEIDSPSFSERGMADALLKKLREIGFTAQEDDAAGKIGGNAGNLYGFLPGTLDAAPLLFCGHMDTVAPAAGKRAIVGEDGIIRSAGDTVLGADDLAAVSAILEAAAALEENHVPHRPVEVLFTVAEETYGHGITNFDMGRLRARDVYVFDYDGTVGSAAIAAPTILKFDVEVEGISSHAGFAPEKGVSAICAAAEAISRIPSGWAAPNATLNFGRIEGGLLTNIVPAGCSVKGEIRSTDHALALSLLKNVETVFGEVCASRGAKVSVTHQIMIRAYATPEDSSVVRRYRRVCGELGLESEFVTTYGGSDNNVLAQYGFSGIVAACGMHACHTCGEYTSVRELETTARIAAALMCTTD